MDKEFFNDIDNMVKVNKLERENAELKAENERLKAELTELEEKFLTLNGKSYSYYMTLQEIKAIADTRFVNGINQEADIYNAQMNEILGLITKAEEE